MQVGSQSFVPRTFASSPTERSELGTTEIVFRSFVRGEHIRGIDRQRVMHSSRKADFAATDWATVPIKPSATMMPKPPE